MKYSLNQKLLIGLKLIFLTIIITFVWFHLNFNTNQSDEKDFKSLLIESNTHSNEYNSLDQFLSKESINKLRKTIELINKEQKVFNFDTFGPLLTNDLVILIQVHNRVKYLSALIKSLEETKDIDRVLLVFSHDLFDPQINSLITSIKFCKFIQIFYPKSMQLYPNSFPGQSSDDCPRDIPLEEAQRIGCKNALNADTYGHYREAMYCQIKHHFWWKINTVMDDLDITGHHSGHFMFLEEDHYLSPDALHVLRLINEFGFQHCHNCNAITLGSYSRSVDFAQNGHQIDSSKWISSQHNMGFVINRTLWNQIKSCAKSFCSYDDYNWDWSLQYVSEKCLNSPIITLFVSTPRVYHMGKCGLHSNQNDCSNEVLVKRLQNVFKSSQSYLFPKRLEFKKQKSKAFSMPKPNGGWSDPRDHTLCLDQTKVFVNEMEINTK